MADRVNSGKKIAYAQEVGESLSSAKASIQKSISNLRAMCDDVRFATADRCYNEIAKIGEVLIKGINEYALGIANEILTPLVSGKGGHMSGEALNAKVAATIPDLEAIAAGAPNIDYISKTVIDERGLDENWTDAKRAAFGEECKYFVGIRAKLIGQIADTTQKCTDSDTKVAYNNLGKKFESLCNSVAAAYNGLTAQLEAAGILVADAIRDMEQAYTSVGTEEAGTAKDILGSPMDV